MGYPNFGKVKTITLPYEEDMTASQYLDRYGIDLATIELYDLINIALDDVVYPVLYIDKVNKVLFMADRAYSYDGGLTVVNNSLINAVIATGTVANAKPIYCHPINIVMDTGETDHVSVSIFVFNNSSEAFTWSTFTQWIRTLISQITIARILTTGSLVIGEVRYPANYLYCDASLRTFYCDEGPIEIAIDADAFDAITPIVFNDGVNKIN